jgi:hypothetical protein
MLKHAYRLGYDAAVKEAGLRSTLKGVGEAVGGRIKGVGKPLQEAVARMRDLQSRVVRGTTGSAGDAAMQSRSSVGVGAGFGSTLPTGSGAVTPEMLRGAQLDVLKETLPWLAAPGAAGLYYGGKAIGKRVFPDSEKSSLERLFSGPAKGLFED